MSLLTSFANASFSTASAVIGTSSVSIGGGTSVAMVVGDRGHDRDFETGGFDGGTTLDVSCLLATFEAAYSNAPETYLGQLVTIGSGSYRLESFRVRDPLIVLMLADSEAGR